MGEDLSDSAKKFLFDNNDFSEDALRKKREAARRPTFTQEQMEASRKAGFDEGRKIGIAETLNSQESQIRDVLQQVVLAASRLEADETKRMATFIEQSALVTAQALSRTLPALLEQMSVEQIAQFMKQVLSEQVRGQTLTVHVAPLHIDQIKTRFEAMLAQSRRKASCSVEADKGLGALQCRFEWTGGGADWDPETVANALLDTIISHLPEHLQGRAKLPPQSVDEGNQTAHNDTITSGDVP